MKYGFLQLLIRHPRTRLELDQLGELMKSRNLIVRTFAIKRYQRGIARAGRRRREWLRDYWRRP